MNSFPGIIRVTLLHALIDIFNSPLPIDAVGGSGPHIEYTFVAIIAPFAISILIDATHSLVKYSNAQCKRVLFWETL